MWLLEPTLKKKFEENEHAVFTLEQAEYETAYKREAYSLVGESANIRIEGVLTKRPSFFAYFFGGGNTTYPEIVEAIDEANADRKVDSIQLNIDSPGGNFSGLFDVLGAIQASKKPVRAYVKDMAASAAYAIASQADSITVNNRSALVGSIGVVVQYYTPAGLDIITSTQAPKKAPDPRTDEGRKAIVEELDALHALFVEAIATGRGVDEKTVNKTYGRGAVLLADEALKRGMIDKIESTGLREVEKVEVTKTDEFKAGIEAERDRVLAHLTMGEASGDMVTACKAIRDGAAMTAELQAKYLAAGMNKADMDRRQADNVNIDGKKETDAGSEVIDIIERKLGVVNG